MSNKQDLTIERTKLMLYLKHELFDNIPKSSNRLTTSNYSNDDIKVHLQYLDDMQVNINRAIDLTRQIFSKPQ